MKAPTYKIVKHLVRILNNLTLNNHYNAANSTNLAINLANLKISENHKLIMYNIKDLYLNIPTEETLAITKSMLLKHNDTQIMQQIITLISLVLSQNYFMFQNKIYQPEKDVSMSSPITSTIAELFLQHFEDIHIKQLLDMKNVIFYKHYVDVILIIYDTKRIHPNLINTYKNKIHTDIKLNPTKENNGCISFLDVFTIRKPSNLETDIFCKPTTTDTTINFFSNHLTEHKVAAFRYHITILHSLPLIPERKQKECTLIQPITQNNNFPKKLLQKLNFQIQHKQTNHDQINERIKNKT